jgi:diacylglycerol O-acyltransferase
MSLAVEMVMAAAEEVPGMLGLITRANAGQVNALVTNVPGPPIPLYMLGSRAHSMQPFVLLMPRVGISVALLSYAGVLHWGFQADTDQVPDLGVFRDDLAQALEDLRRHAEERLPVESDDTPPC